MSQTLRDLMQQSGRTESKESFVLQNSKMLKVRVTDEVYCRAGSMIAYQGDLKFERTSGGIGKWLKKTVTGEGVPLMKASGNGDLFLAHKASDITVLRLSAETLFVEGRHLLAFENTVDWDVTVIRGAGMTSGGLFTCRLTGTGFVAITSHGPVAVLEAPVAVDPDSLIGWTEGIVPQVKTDVNLKTLLGRSSGETFQLYFDGYGKVLVQPDEPGLKR
ncbi:MAG: AIM24 family protein [Planifilum fimeticola]